MEIVYQDKSDGIKKRRETNHIEKGKDEERLPGESLVAFNKRVDQKTK